MQSDYNNNKNNDCCKSKKELEILNLKFKERFSIYAFNSTITEAKNKINAEENNVNRRI